MLPPCTRPSVHSRRLIQTSLQPSAAVVFVHKHAGHRNCEHKHGLHSLPACRTSTASLASSPDTSRCPSARGTATTCGASSRQRLGAFLGGDCCAVCCMAPLGKAAQWGLPFTRGLDVRYTPISCHHHHSTMSAATPTWLAVARAMMCTANIFERSPIHRMLQVHIYAACGATVHPLRCCVVWLHDAGGPHLYSLLGPPGRCIL